MEQGKGPRTGNWNIRIFRGVAGRLKVVPPVVQNAKFRIQDVGFRVQMFLRVHPDTISKDVPAVFACRVQIVCFKLWVRVHEAQIQCVGFRI